MTIFDFYIVFILWMWSFAGLLHFCFIPNKIIKPPYEDLKTTIFALICGPWAFTLWILFYFIIKSSLLGNVIWKKVQNRFFLKN